VVSVIESNPALAKQVKKIRWAHGSEEIELMSGARYVVKAANAAELMAQPDIDGALVGGAALDAEEFARIVQYRLS
jgi:triosephosphate isomerase